MSHKYSKLQITLHWAIAILILLQFVLHDHVKHAFREITRGNEVAFDPLVAQHVFGGLLILALVILRLIVRMKQGAPELPAEESDMMKKVANGVHWGLYALMALLPISGAVAWFTINRNAAEAHEFMKAAMLALLALHVAGALFHQFILKTKPFSRIWF